jgi:hypothetical protein
MTCFLLIRHYAYPFAMEDSRRFLDQISAGYQDAIILLTANHLGVFDALEVGPRTVADLACELQCAPRGLDLLLCALAAGGIVEQCVPGRFQLNAELAPHLVTQSDRSLHSILDHHYHLLARWVQLADVVRTGQPASGSHHHSDSSLCAFICGMRDLARHDAQEVVAVLPELELRRRLLDLGGGPGTSAITFCQHWSQLSAVVFDLPTVTPIATAEITAAGMVDRIQIRAGDFQVDPLLPPQEPTFDVVYLSNIIHSLDPQAVRQLLGRIIPALAPEGLLVIKEFFLEDSGTSPGFAARFAVNMLVGTTGGKSYTWTETERLCREVGFTGMNRRKLSEQTGLLLAYRTSDP